MANERGKRAVTLKQAVALVKVLNEWDSDDVQASESVPGSSSTTSPPPTDLGSQQHRARRVPATVNRAG